ncbi:MAG: restriction endonuclease subunit R [Scytonema sp. PMC 1069.18]|nr:restriction endonuclease subunit R [Scytonema sp. PMC 1069.18]MEC4887560.1 restriction endonuclease subunit R [Scytonema sp. PMC 1070.18]
MALLQAKNLYIGDVHRLFGFQRQYNNKFDSLLSLEPLTEFEQQELLQIRSDFDNYLIDSKVLEGLVKALTVFPLIWLAGFSRPPIKIALEENIADLVIEDEDTRVTGRLDILAINKVKEKKDILYFWVLVIESKNSDIDALAGLPQLLTYAYDRLEYQTSVWGLTTNGRIYQFVYIQQGNPPKYQLMPSLNLMESERAIELLQVLKAICQG